MQQKPSSKPWLMMLTLVATASFVSGVAATHLPMSHDETPLPVPVQAFSSNHNASDLTNVIPKKGRQPFFGLSDNPVADIVASVSPAVVSVDTTIHRTPVAAVGFPNMLFSQVSKQQAGFDAHGAGSGVVIRQDGYILTNAHVVKDADEIRVTLSNKHVYIGHVVGKDPNTDVALVKIEAVNLPVARMAESRKTRPGDWAIAIGSPLGLSQTVTMGIVSAIGRSLSDLNNKSEMIQTDAAINPGNSGGPLLNIHGEVVGINMAIRTDAQNIGFSIPIDIARESANSILSNQPAANPQARIAEATGARMTTIPVSRTTN